MGDSVGGQCQEPELQPTPPLPREGLYHHKSPIVVCSAHSASLCHMFGCLFSRILFIYLKKK